MGLLAAAMAGGLGGAGEAAEKGFTQMQETESKKQLISLQEQLATQREALIQGLRGENALAVQGMAGDQAMARTNVEQSGATERTRMTEEGATGRTRMTEEGANARNKASLESHERASKYTADAGVTSSRISAGAHIRAAEISAESHRYSTDMQKAIAEMQVGANDWVFQPDAEGRYIRVNKRTGENTGYLNGPDGKPLQGPKDVAQSTLAFAKILTDSARTKEQMGDMPGAQADRDMALKVLGKGGGAVVTREVETRLAGFLGTDKEKQALSDFEKVFGKEQLAATLAYIGAFKGATSPSKPAAAKPAAPVTPAEPRPPAPVSAPAMGNRVNPSVGSGLLGRALEDAPEWKSPRTGR